MPSLLSLSPFGVIDAAIAAVVTVVTLVDVVLVAPATVALAIARGGIDKKNCGLEKKAKKVPCFFSKYVFGDQNKS
jgi:hypothetical protein